MEEIKLSWQACIKLLSDTKFIETQQQTIIWTVILFLVIYGSSSYAASIAEDRNHNRLTHFFLGMILPIGYPLYLLFTMTVKGTVVTEVKEEINNVDELLGAGEDGLFGDAMMDYNENYFRKIYLTKDGDYTGPYLIEMDGNFLTIQRILEVEKQFIVVENQTDKGELQRMRVPYEKIYNCNLA